MNRPPVDRRRELVGVLYLVCAVLLSIAFYVPSAGTGSIGRIVVGAGKGLFGSAAYALPVFFLYITAEYFLDLRHLRRQRRLAAVLLLLVAVAALLHLITVDPRQIHAMSLADDGAARASLSVGALWRTGADPALLSSGGRLILSGGILGGGIAHGLLAIAGDTGALVLAGALVLSLLILIFNWSFTALVGRTARIVGQTGRRFGSAASRGTEANSTRSTAPPIHPGDTARSAAELPPQDPGAYDIRVATPARSPYDQPLTRKDGDLPVPAEAHPVVSGSSESGRKLTLLENLKRMFKPDEPEPEPGLRGLSAQDLPVPGFLQSDPQNAEAYDPRSANARELNRRAAEATQPDAAPGLIPEYDKPSAGGIVQRSSFDLHIDPPSSAAGDPDRRAADGQDTPPAAGTSGSGLLRPIRIPRDADKAASHDEDPDGIPINPDEKDISEGHGRAHWADRTDQPSGKGIRKPRTSQQIALDFPYQAPQLDLLKVDRQPLTKTHPAAIQALGQKLEQTLESFGVSARVVQVTTGPTITRFELSPGQGVKVSRIVSLADDIALNLAALGVRIEAPIPGKSAIGIEIPNKEASPVLLRGLLETPEYARDPSPLLVPIGRDIQGNPILCDLTRMPHLLIAGATGSGKSVCINAILISILYRASPKQVKLIMIDPKVVELSAYNGIPHLKAPVVTDPKKASAALQLAVNEMSRRYDLFAEKRVRDINGYRQASSRSSEEFENLPLILFVIDELADLMATTQTEVENAISRLTALARAAGIHLLIATQRPSVDVITGVIKANMPSRIAFSVASQVDSRTILDQGGAEKLLGRGDMLYFPQSSAKPTRGQGAFVSDSEVEQVLGYIKERYAPEYDDAFMDALSRGAANSDKERDSGDQDELLPKALQIVIEVGHASVSILQRRLNVGYPRAARLIDRMSEAGFVGPFEGSKPRKVLITKSQFQERFINELDGDDI